MFDQFFHRPMSNYRNKVIEMKDRTASAPDNHALMKQLNRSKFDYPIEVAKTHLVTKKSW